MATTLEAEGKNYELDDDGFLVDVDSWSISLVKELAKKQGIEKLTSNHWMLITAVRTHFDKHGVVPSYHDILGRTGLKKEDMYKLFSSGHLRGAYKLAGVPKPAGDY